ncbi:hypothetical protein BN871_HA_00040 [Paenibacillus sp. P22]|nr:hypothetical protein BN871_HA_00040 [Paenibacillus sp. P22]
MLHDVGHRFLDDQEQLMLLGLGNRFLHPPVEDALQPVLPAVIREPARQRILERAALQLQRPQLRDKTSHLLLSVGGHRDELFHDFAGPLGTDLEQLGQGRGRHMNGEQLLADGIMQVPRQPLALLQNGFFIRSRLLQHADLVLPLHDLELPFQRFGHEVELVVSSRQRISFPLRQTSRQIAARSLLERQMHGVDAVLLTLADPISEADAHNQAQKRPRQPQLSGRRFVHPSMLDPVHDTPWHDRAEHEERYQLQPAASKQLYDHVPTSPNLRHPDISDKCAAHQLDLAFRFAEARALRIRMLEHPAFLASKHLGIADEGAGYDLDADIRIGGKEYFHISDERADRNFRLSHRNVRASQIQHGVSDEMGDVERNEIPVIMAQMDIPDEVGACLGVGIGVPPFRSAMIVPAASMPVMAPVRIPVFAPRLFEFMLGPLPVHRLARLGRPRGFPLIVSASGIAGRGLSAAVCRLSFLPVLSAISRPSGSCFRMQRVRMQRRSRGNGALIGSIRGPFPVVFRFFRTLPPAAARENHPQSEHDGHDREQKLRRVAERPIRKSHVAPQHHESEQHHRRAGPERSSREQRGQPH